MRRTAGRAAFAAVLLLVAATTGTFGAGSAAADGNTPATPLPPSKVKVEVAPFPRVTDVRAPRLS